MKKFMLPALAILAFSSCDDQKPTETTETTDSVAVEEKVAVNPVGCFEFKTKGEFGEDVTSCSIVAGENGFTGTYDWSPYEKDGAYGELSNGVLRGDTLILDWAYTIEGSEQAEQIAFIVGDGKLTALNGELEDKNGMMVMKDMSKAPLGEVLSKVECETPKGE